MKKIAQGFPKREGYRRVIEGKFERGGHSGPIWFLRPVMQEGGGCAAGGEIGKESYSRGKLLIWHGGKRKQFERKK